MARSGLGQSHQGCWSYLHQPRTSLETLKDANTLPISNLQLICRSLLSSNNFHEWHLGFDNIMLFHHSGLAAAKRKAEKEASGTAKRPKGKAKAKSEVKVEPVKKEANCQSWSSKLKTSVNQNETQVFSCWCFETLCIPQTQVSCILHMDGKNGAQQK